MKTRVGVSTLIGLFLAALLVFALALSLSREEMHLTVDSRTVSTRLGPVVVLDANLLLGEHVTHELLVAYKPGTFDDASRQPPKVGLDELDSFFIETANGRYPVADDGVVWVEADGTWRPLADTVPAGVVTDPKALAPYLEGLMTPPAKAEIE